MPYSNEALFEDEFYLPFAKRAGFEQLVTKARELVTRGSMAPVGWPSIRA